MSLKAGFQTGSTPAYYLEHKIQPKATREGLNFMISLNLRQKSIKKFENFLTLATVGSSSSPSFVSLSVEKTVPILRRLYIACKGVNRFIFQSRSSNIWLSSLVHSSYANLYLASL